VNAEVRAQPSILSATVTASSVIDTSTHKRRFVLEGRKNCDSWAIVAFFHRIGYGRWKRGWLHRQTRGAKPAVSTAFTPFSSVYGSSALGNTASERVKP